MVVSDEIHNIMGGIESAGDVRLHNHRRKLRQRFDIVKKLGQGTYGKVQLGINKETGQEVAIKTIRKCKIETEADLIRIRREIQIMSSVRHPNIIHIYEVFENREKMVLVMEYAAGGELYDYLSERKVLAEEEARRIFRQIAMAIYYCHKHNICHRDLKLENILLDEVGNAKIADFGLSNVFTYSSLLSTFCGSPLYASPEIVKGTPYVGPEVDCWSLGVLLYTLVYGAMPFDGSNFKRLVKQISHGDYFEPKTPSSASSLISDMLNVNPARRADIQAICSHWWINETYSDVCLDLAEDLASQTPVRHDLLLSLTASAVNTKKAVGVDQAAANEDLPAPQEKPVRSQSLDSIPPSAVIPNVKPLTLHEAKESVPEPDDKISKPTKKERSHSKTKRKERSRSRPRNSNSQKASGDAAKSGESKVESNLEKVAAGATPLVNSGTQVITKAAAETTEQVEPSAAPTSIPVAVESESTKGDVVFKAEPEPLDKSALIDEGEKIETAHEKRLRPVPSKKLILPDNVCKEFERSTSVVSGDSSPSKKTATPSPNTPILEPFPLASTVALNKLVESAFRDDPEFDFKAPSFASVGDVAKDEDRTPPKLMSSSSAETNVNKTVALPRRTSRAEIQLSTPVVPSNNYKAEIEHFVNKPVVTHKTEVIIPVSAPLPPKPLTKADNQSKEHIIPIQFEQESVYRKVTSPPPSLSASKSSIARTSSSNLSRQSTLDSDSGSTIGTGEPLRKSPREVIIPIAVEGGGYVTPRTETFTKLNRSSLNNGEEEDADDNRCFTLRSTKRRQPEQSSSGQLDTADSLSSDEDDNFQLLTTENLFSSLLSRMRNLTHRLSDDEMRRPSAFPRSLFAQHGSFFDDFPSPRLSATRSFGRTENSPWRRKVMNNSTPQRETIIPLRVPTELEDSPDE